jgi:glucose-1-phosphate thymidylyltransferase
VVAEHGLIISTPKDTPLYEELLGDGSQLGIKISYKTQTRPDGLAQAFILGEEFIGDDDVCLILGDNIFHGDRFITKVKKSCEIVEKERKAVVFGYYVKDPERYGVIEFDNEGNVKSIEEKPKVPKSNYAVVGLYFYDKSVVDIVKSITPSDRGELEITSVNQVYLDKGKLAVEIMGRGYAWLDTGTYESLVEASNYIQIMEQRMGLKIACIEEIAYEKNYINQEQLLRLAEPLKKTQYGEYLLKIAEEK